MRHSKILFLPKESQYSDSTAMIPGPKSADRGTYLHDEALDVLDEDAGRIHGVWVWLGEWRVPARRS